MRRLNRHKFTILLHESSAAFIAGIAGVFLGLMPEIFDRVVHPV